MNCYSTQRSLPNGDWRVDFGSYVDANIPNARDYNFDAYTNSIDVASSKQDSSPDTSWRPTRFASEESHLQERSTEYYDQQKGFVTDSTSIPTGQYNLHQLDPVKKSLVKHPVWI